MKEQIKVMEKFHHGYVDAHKRWKLSCHKAALMSRYGGELWVKLWLILGGIPPRVVEIYNDHVRVTLLSPLH